jgi:hypothetical protein
MKRTYPVLVGLALGLGALARAQTVSGATLTAPNAPAAATTVTTQGAPRLAENTPVIIVGEITSEPKSIVSESKAQVAIGPAKMDYTLHLSDARMTDNFGAEIKPDKLSDKMWVRAEGTIMNDPRRVKVTRLQVIGKDMPGLKQSAFYRPGFDQGYIMAVAGTRQIYPTGVGTVYTPAPLTIIGRVSDDTGPLESTRKIQVDSAGNTWTFSVPKDTPLFDAAGKKISVHQIAKGQWIRAHGWQTDDLRLRVARLQEIGPQAAYGTSAYFRAGEPLGYVERTPGTEVRFNPVQVTGTVTAISSAAGTATVRDSTGKEWTFPLESVSITANGRPVPLEMLRQGQNVTITGSEIAF